MDKEKLKIIEYRANLALSDEWMSIKKLLIEKILNLSKSQTDPIELRGMLKMINYIDNWAIEFQEKKNKE